MIDLFTAKPVVTLPPSIVHYIEPIPARQTKAERKKYMAGYRERNREQMRKIARESARRCRAAKRKAEASA